MKTKYTLRLTLLAAVIGSFAAIAGDFKVVTMFASERTVSATADHEIPPPPHTLL